MNDIPRSRLRMIVLLTLLICHSPALPAAEAVSELKAGDRLRIQVISHSAVYILDSIDSGEFTLHREGRVMPERIRLEDIRSIEVDTGPSYGKSVSKYGGTGFMVGAGIGLIIGYTRGSDPPCSGQEICTSLSAESKAVLWGAGLGLLGAVIGGLYGNTHPVPDWKPVGVEQIPESLSIDCDHRGIFLSYGF